MNIRNRAWTLALGSLAMFAVVSVSVPTLAQAAPKPTSGAPSVAAGTVTDPTLPDTVARKKKPRQVLFGTCARQGANGEWYFFFPGETTIAQLNDGTIIEIVCRADGTWGTTGATYRAPAAGPLVTTAK